MTEKHVEKGIHKNSNLAESEALDDEFIKVLKRASRPRLPKKAPDWVKKNVINNYKKQHKYLILWYDVKVKFTEYKEALFGTGRGLEIALASTIILLILGGITYYQYRKPQSSPIGIIANQETPAIKVTPNSSDTPIATPSPIQTISPDIAKSPEKNINNEKTLNKLNEKKNNKDLTAKRQENRNKPNTKIQSNNPIPQNNNLDNKDNQQEEMAITKVQPNNPTSQNNNLDNKDNQQGDLTTVTRGNNAKLATIKNIYVSNFIEKNLRNALIELLKDKGFNVFENLANANTPIDAQLEYNLPETNALILSINNKTVFEKSLTGVSPKEHAQTIVSSLIEAIERNKTEQKQK